ncbi:hypothetical protein LTR84_007200 [Exophiala bonariae]|uniref:Uncharacterized protein n=1 Tax=Exophiala bonariae TaxID=1690606 RepID=A0AAV9N2G8_9EURO|nr:hypothetical protein LTR84_007200 [Exophiala bonariae]
MGSLRPVAGLPSPVSPLSPRSSDSLLAAAGQQTTIPRSITPTHRNNENILVPISMKARYNSNGSASSRLLWQSLWLRKRTLLAFLLLFTVLCISLLILWQYDNQHDGIRLTVSTNHYAWTYGPAAILVVVVSLWRQVDYQCKANQPWLELSKGPSIASKSILLDYISPLQITSFSRAVQSSHYAVAASVLGFAILKLVLAASTTLLVASSTPVSNDFDVQIATRFTGEEFWQTIPDQVDGTTTAKGFIGNQITESAYKNISSDPVYSYWGVIRGELTDPLGTKDGIAFQVFNSSLTNENLTSLTSTVSAFVPNITCEIPVWESFQNMSGEWGPLVQLRLNTPTCKAGYGDYEIYVDTADVVAAPMNDNLCAEDCLPYPTSFTIQRVFCGTAESEAAKTVVNGLSPHDYRFAIVAANISQQVGQPSWTNDTNVTEVIGRGIVEAGVVLCNIDYNMVEAEVTHDMADDSYSLPTELTALQGGHLSDLGGLQLSELIFSSLSIAADAFAPQDIGPYIPTPDMDTLASNPLFTLMADRLEGKKSRERFFDPTTLQQAAVSALTGVSAQFMQQNFLKSTNEASTGKGVYHEQRLHIQRPSLWIMVTGFIILDLLTLVLVFTATTKSTPQDPRSIAAHATILTTSSSIQAPLCNTGDLRTSGLTKQLGEFEYRSVVDQHFYLEALPRSKEAERMNDGGNFKSSMWIPLSAKFWFVCLTATAPILAIAALEALYRRSEANQGLKDVSGESSVLAFARQYLSSLVLLLIATLFNTLDFAITTFAPFSALRKGIVSSEVGLLMQLQGNTPLLALYQAISHSHMGAALSNMATLVGSALPIVVAGLWVLDDATTFTNNVVVTASSAWDVAPINSTTEGSGAAPAFNNVERGVVNLPAGVWNDLVFPQISELTTVYNSRDPSLDSSTSALNYTLTIPALRPELICDIVPADLWTISYETDPNDPPNMADWSVKWELPPGCHGGPWGNRSYATIRGGYWEDSWYGQMYDLHLGPWNASNLENREVQSHAEVTFGHADQPDNPCGCPSIAVFFGYVGQNYTAQENVTMLVCNQRITQVQTAITYDGDPLNNKPNTAREPVPDESTARYMTNGTDGVVDFNYRLQYDLQSGLVTFNPGNEPDYFDQFFNHLVYGPEGVSPKQLLGPQNANNLRAAVQKLYKRYMVHVIDRKFRQPLDAAAESLKDKRKRQDAGTGAQTSQYEGVVMQQIPRLKVDYISKLILQIMLATMTLLGILSFWLVKLRGTLPRNPCSIASTMSLFAGSEMCKSEKEGGIMPAGAEWMTREELKHVWKGKHFSLGWWTAAERSLSNANAREMETLPQRGSRMKLGNMEEIRLADEAIDRETLRFGIDVGVPIRLGFRQRRGWRERLKPS